MKKNPKGCNDSDQWLSLSRLRLNPRVAHEIWAPSALSLAGHREPFTCQTWRPGSSRLVVLQAVGGKSFATNFTPLNPAGGYLHSSGAAPRGTQARVRQWGENKTRGAGNPGVTAPARHGHCTIRPPRRARGGAAPGLQLPDYSSRRASAAPPSARRLPVSAVRK